MKSLGNRRATFVCLFVIVVRLWPFTYWEGWKESDKRRSASWRRDLSVVKLALARAEWCCWSVLPQFPFLGAPFRSKAKANTLFTAVLSSTFPRESLKIRPYMKRGKNPTSFTHLFSLWNSTLRLYSLEISDEIPNKPKDEVPKKREQDYSASPGPSSKQKLTATRCELKWLYIIVSKGFMDYYGQSAFPTSLTQILSNSF